MGPAIRLYLATFAPDDAKWAARLAAFAKPYPEPDAFDHEVTQPGPGVSVRFSCP